MQAHALVKTLRSGVGPDSLSQALEIHVPLEGKVFSGRGLDRDISAGSPQILSIRPSVSNTYQILATSISHNHACQRIIMQGQAHLLLNMELHQGMLRRQPAQSSRLTYGRARRAPGGVKVGIGDDALAGDVEA